jgi:predicted transcriptional regulator
MAMTTDVADKWGQQIAERGFAQIPNYLLLLNQFMDKERRFSPLEMLILIQLVGAWWKKEAMPFPSMATLAARCGVSDRQIQRSINRLVELKLIVRTQRHAATGVRSNNLYDLKPLITMLNHVAKAFPNGYPRGIGKVGKEASGLRPAIVDMTFDDELPAQP